MATDNMSKYDSAAVGATVAGGTTFAVLMSKMKAEQELFNKTDGKKGVDWQGDAKKLDTKLKDMPKSMARKFKQNLTDSVTSVSGKVKEVLGVKTPDATTPDEPRYDVSAEEKRRGAKIQKLKEGSPEYRAEQLAQERIKKGTAARRAKMKADTPVTRSFTKFPTKSVATGLASAGMGMYLDSKADELKGSDSKGLDRLYDDVVGDIADYASPIGGFGALGTTGIVANEALTRKLRGMYDPDGSLGMNRRDAYKRYFSDLAEATSDYKTSKGNKLKAARLSALRKVGLGSDTVEDRVALAESNKELAKKKEARFTNVEVEKAEEARQKRVDEERLDRQLETSTKEKTFRDTATHNSMRNNINTRIDDLRASLSSSALMTGAEKATPETIKQSAYLDSEIKKLEGLRTKLDSIPEHELSKATEFKDFEPGKVQKGYEETKKQGKKATRKAEKAAAAAQVATADVTEKAKTKLQRATQATADTVNNLKRKAGLSTAAAFDGATRAAKGLSYYNKHPFEAVGKAAYKTPVAAAKLGSKALAVTAPGNALNYALKVKRDLEEQGVSPIVQQLIDSGASESEINEAIREDMYATAFAATGIPEMADQLTDWVGKDLSVYDRGTDILGTGVDIVKGVGEGIVSGGKGMMDLAGRTYDWATGEGEFGELRDDKGEYRNIPGYDTPTVAPVTAKKKTSGVTAAGTEGDDLQDKRKIAEANNKRLWAAQKDDLQRKYGGYESAQDYAKQYGVTAVDTSSGRYGNTPIYKGVDEFGNVSYSDVPTSAMDPSKYDEVAGQAANVARQQYVQFEKAAKKQAQDQSMPAYLRGKIPYEEYSQMPVAERLKANTEAYKIQSANAKATDLYERNKAMSIGLAQGDPGYIEQLTQQVLSGAPTRDEMTKTKYALNKQRIEDSFKWNPFAKDADPYAVHPREDLSGYWSDSVEEPMEPLAKGYTKLAPYAPK